MKHGRRVYLEQMSLCARRVAAYTVAGKAAFMEDTKTQDAVIRNLEIIGQVVRDLDADQLSALAPAVPWQQIAGMRNVLAHQYLGVDANLVWNVVEQHLPLLRTEVERLISTIASGTDKD